MLHWHFYGLTVQSGTAGGDRGETWLENAKGHGYANKSPPSRVRARGIAVSRQYASPFPGHLLEVAADLPRVVQTPKQKQEICVQADCAAESAGLKQILRHEKNAQAQMTSRREKPTNLLRARGLRHQVIHYDEGSG